MSSDKQQTMKPSTAAKKLGIYLPATPDDFREGLVTRSELNDLIENPPEWLVQLRLTGPHPRDIVARKLGISISGLARAGVDDVMTTDDIHELLQSPPEWLVRERQVQADVRAENKRVNDRDAERAARAAASDGASNRSDAPARDRDRAFDDAE